MARRPILTWPDPRLRMTAAPVTAFDADLAGLAAEMLETMYAAPGRGLAATQVGVMARLFVMDCGWKDGRPEPLACINPVLSDPSADLAARAEGCLSLPGLTVTVARPAAVTLAWQGLDGAHHSRRLDGFAATCAQHEVDHLDGRLCTDLAAPDDRPAIAAALARLAG
jgi:peptide deformylase